jgi:hypothetical protein
LRSGGALSRVRTKSRVPLARVSLILWKGEEEEGAYSKILDGFHVDGSVIGTPDVMGGCGAR